MRLKGFAPIIILVVVIILSAIGYFAYTKGFISINLPISTTSPVPSPVETPSATTISTVSWKNEVRQIHGKSEVRGNIDYNFGFSYPSDWSIQKITSTHENDKLITNCVNYTLTNTKTNASIVIEPICTDWAATYYPYPSNSEIVQKINNQGNDGHTVYWIRYFSSEMNMYAYYEASVSQGESISANTKVMNVVLISYLQGNGFYIPVKFWLSAPAGTKINDADISTSDLILKSLKFSRI